MDRRISYAQALVQSADALSINKNTMVALGVLAEAILGNSTLVDGLGCTPTGPASMQVQIARGSIYQFGNVDATAFGSLAADTTHNIVKQGISLDTVLLTLTAPSTTGQSRNYLVQAAFSETDTGSAVLPYYNSSNPAAPFGGPNNTGTSQNQNRQGLITINLKAGAAATTGTQTTPAPDAGFTGLWVITVANGQTTITSGNIVKASAAPFINYKLPALSPGAGSVTGTVKKLTGVWASNSTANYLADEVVVSDGAGSASRLTGFSKQINTATSGIGGLSTGSTAASTWYAVYAAYNPSTATQGIFFDLSFSTPTLPSGYTQYARIGSIWLDGSKNIRGFSQAGKSVQHLVGANLSGLPQIINGSTGDPTIPTYTSASISSVVPPTAGKVSVSLSTEVLSVDAKTICAPNSNYGAYNDTSNPPPLVIWGTSTNMWDGQVATFVIESTNIYYASTAAAGGVYALGYEDNL